MFSKIVGLRKPLFAGTGAGYILTPTWIRKWLISK